MLPAGSGTQALQLVGGTPGPRAPPRPASATVRQPHRSESTRARVRPLSAHPSLATTTHPATEQSSLAPSPSLALRVLNRDLASEARPLSVSGAWSARGDGGAQGPEADTDIVSVVYSHRPSSAGGPSTPLLAGVVVPERAGPSESGTGMEFMEIIQEGMGEVDEATWARRRSPRGRARPGRPPAPLSARSASSPRQMGAQERRPASARVTQVP